MGAKGLVKLACRLARKERGLWKDNGVVLTGQATWMWKLTCISRDTSRKCHEMGPLRLKTSTPL